MKPELIAEGWCFWLGEGGLPPWTVERPATCLSGTRARSGMALDSGQPSAIVALEARRS
jgi:hypothetical protein